RAGCESAISKDKTALAGPRPRWWPTRWCSSTRRGSRKARAKAEAEPRLFSGRRLLRGDWRPSDFPEIAVWIREVAEISAPRCILRWLGNRAAGALGFGQHGIDAVFGADVVGEGDAAKAAAVRS